MTKERTPRPPPSQPTSSEGSAVVELHTILPNKLSLVRVTQFPEKKFFNSCQAKYPDKFFFSSHKQERYVPYCHDFGPVDLSVVHEFHSFVKEYFFHPNLVKADRELVYYTKGDPEIFTNTCFLLASFLVIEIKMTPQAAWKPFESFAPRGDVVFFRDATDSPQDYFLSVLSCLEGLNKAIECGWYHPDTFKKDQYIHLQDPRHTGMNFVTPKLVACQGPVSARNKKQAQAENYGATQPIVYVKAFEEQNIGTVIRLNEPTYYDRKEFTKHGVAHHDLYFDDCTTPTRGLIQDFISLVEQSADVVMVHCRAGLGRTGTLIAAYMMKHHDFSASECIGWLRIVRPGSVLGPQQQFLHEVERHFRKSNRAPNYQMSPSSPMSPSRRFRQKSATGPASSMASTRNNSFNSNDSDFSANATLRTEDTERMGEGIAQAQLRRAVRLADSLSSAEKTKGKMLSTQAYRKPLGDGFSSDQSIDDERQPSQDATRTSNKAGQDSIPFFKTRQSSFTRLAMHGDGTQHKKHPSQTPTFKPQSAVRPELNRSTSMREAREVLLPSVASAGATSKKQQLSARLAHDAPAGLALNDRFSGLNSKFSSIESKSLDAGSRKEGGVKFMLLRNFQRFL